MSNNRLTLQQLAEGIQTKTLGTESKRITNKWKKVGLLEGLNTLNQEKMARLLESQATELFTGTSRQQILQEANAITTGGAGLTSSGQIAGFTNVAFPIVRKVFAGLIANEIVSVQPMSLPAGLLFYLDYTYGSYVGGDAGTAANQYSTTTDPGQATYARGQSVYNLPTGANIRSGSLATGGQYNLINSAFSRVHVEALNLIAANNSVGSWASGSTWEAAKTVANTVDFTGYNARHVDFSDDVKRVVDESTLDYCFVFMSASELTSKINGFDPLSVEQIAVVGVGGTPGGATTWGTGFQGGEGVLNLRRMNQRGNWNPLTGIFTPDAIGGSHIKFVLALSNTSAVPTLGNATTAAVTASAVISDALTVNSDGSAFVLPSFESNFALDASPRIPEVDIKIESVAVTATSRKLRARWSPEMAQDLTAFYSIDVEAELTNILSELITLDIDREILNDLLTQANAANFYWSRAVGRLVNKVTGVEATRASSLSPGPAFYGDQQQWYQTLIEVISDAANQINKKTLRGSGNFLVTSPEVATILQHTNQYKASYKVDGDGQVKDGMQIGVEASGTLNNRYVVYVDPYFPANKILIGLKGNNFLETGYIYAPYIPLILTPVIYGQEDFTPRKGIMTRYAKRMIRSDFYATVTVLDMNVGV